MRIVSFVTQKGGTGKSTLAFNVAVAAAEAGETVALFDLDKQGMVSKWADTREGLREDAEREGNTKLAEQLSYPHVEHVPATRLPTFAEQLKAINGYSLIILDTKGEDSPAQRIAMQVATYNVVVIRPSRADVDMSMPTIEALINSNKAWTVALTQCLAIPGNQRAPETGAIWKRMGKLIEPLVWSRVEYQDAYSSGFGVTEQNASGKAAAEIRSFWAALDRATKEKKS